MREIQNIATRQSLLSRLKDWEDQQSWQQFYDTYWRVIYHFALRSGLNDPEAQEVLQETVIEIAQRIHDFKYKARDQGGSFKAWLANLTRWRIQDQLRKRRLTTPLHIATDPSGTTTTEPELTGDLNRAEESWENEWRDNLMQAAMERLRKSLPAKHFQAFDLYVTRNWAVGKVAQTVGISVGQVYLIRFRVLKLLKAEIKRLETQLI